MCVCVGTDYGERSEWFDVEQSLRHGCVLAPLLFNIFFTAVLKVAPAYFRLDPDIVDDMLLKIQRRNSSGAGAMECSEGV